MEHGEERGERQPIVVTKPLLWALELGPPGVWSCVELRGTPPQDKGAGCSLKPALPHQLAPIAGEATWALRPEKILLQRSIGAGS